MKTQTLALVAIVTLFVAASRQRPPPSRKPPAGMTRRSRATSRRYCSGAARRATGPAAWRRCRWSPTRKCDPGRAPSARRLPSASCRHGISIRRSAFANSPMTFRLSDAEIDTVLRWVDAGAPLGDPNDMPAPIEWPAGRHLETGGQVPGTGRAGSRDPVDPLDTGCPGAGSVVPADCGNRPRRGSLGRRRWKCGPHSSGGRSCITPSRNLMQEEDPDDFEAAVDVPGTGSYFTEFAVGKIGDVFRENTGKLLKADSRVRFDLHYHSVGEEITDSTELGIWLYPEGLHVPKYRVYAQAMGVRQAMLTLDIPPGEVTEHEAFIPLRLPGPASRTSSRTCTCAARRCRWKQSIPTAKRR